MQVTVRIQKQHFLLGHHAFVAVFKHKTIL